MKNRKKDYDVDVSIDNFLSEVDEEDAEKLKDYYEKSKEDAKKIINDQDRMEKFFQKLEKKLKTVPVAGSALAYIPLMMSFVRSYVKKEYTDPPITSIVSVVVALIYFLSPIDIIPDTVPALGLSDDALVIAGCLTLVKTDLEDYRIWRKENGMEYEDIPDYDNIMKEAGEQSKIVKAFFRGRKK